jgi:hypothetical protein
MLKALLLMTGMVVSTDTIPEPIAVVPLVMEATLSKVYPDGRPSDHPISVHLGSFMSELNRMSDDPVSALEVKALLEDYGYSKDLNKTPFCPDCDLSHGPRMWVKIQSMERTESGYRVRVREEHPYRDYDGEWVRSFSEFPYEFVWTGDGWETKVSGRIRQS